MVVVVDGDDGGAGVVSTQGVVQGVLLWQMNPVLGSMLSLAYHLLAIVDAPEWVETLT